MTSPVDHLRDRVADREGCADDEPRTRAAAASLLRRRPRQLRGGRRPRGRRFDRRRLALGARRDQARLQLAEELRVVGERGADLRLDAAASLRLLDDRLELVGGGLDCLVAARHRFVGGSSPVATRQIFDASLRAAIVEAAPIPA
jgi:hypothetical protein